MGRLALLLLVAVALDAGAAVVPADAPEPPFSCSAELVPAVDFWTRVYTVVDTASGFVHDERRLDIIYQTLYLNPEAPPAAQNEAIDKELEAYRRALAALASGKRSELTGLEAQALRAWGDGVTNTELKEASRHVRFQRGQADRFQQGLRRSRRWKARIQALFRGRGLPVQLAALPHVESSYNPRARSKAGAVGLWQFMPATARRYLRVDELVDERLDPLKSSEAAAHLLQQNYSVLKRWPLAITAYNHGLSGVRRAVRETGTEDLGRIVDLYEGDRFGFASRNFYAAFLAAVDVSENPGRYFARMPADAAETIRVLTPAYLPVDVIVSAFGVGKDRLRSLNPTLHHAVWNGTHFVPKDYALTLPGHGSELELVEKLGELSRHFGFGSQKPYESYEARWGDSLSVIAQRHDTTVAQLVAMNKLSSVHEIHAGQVLRVPMGPVPEPLGAGAAAMLETQLARGDLYDTLPAEVSRAIAYLGPDQDTAERDAAPIDVVPSRWAEGLCGDPGLREFAPGPDDGAESADRMLAAAPSETQPDLAADPVDYSVRSDGTIEIQIAETLGHYADWLDLKAESLKTLNALGDEQPLIVGQRLKLDFSQVARERFEQNRIAFHKSRQLAYFRRYRISGVLEHRVKEGDNLWLLAVQQYQVPMWLLRQYNPDIDTDTVLSLDGVIAVPLVRALSPEEACLLGENAREGVTRTGDIALRN